MNKEVKDMIDAIELTREEMDSVIFAAKENKFKATATKEQFRLYSADYMSSMSKKTLGGI